MRLDSPELSSKLDKNEAAALVLLEVASDGSVKAVRVTDTT